MADFAELNESGGIKGPPARRGQVRAACLSSCLAALVWAAAASGATASDPKPPAKAAGHDKSRYTLFNPTPDNLLRDLTTDRPDTTESPFTVDAGHLQIETNIFGYARTRADPDGTVARSYDYAVTNFRIGLSNQVEFNVAVQPHGVIKTRSLDPAGSTRSSGAGGVDLRMKINLWGNDTFEKPGTTAFGLLPFLTLATDRDNGISPAATEGGLILPFAVKLTDKFALGLNGGFHLVRDDGDEPGARPGTHTEWLSSASLSYEWTGTFSTYYEVAGRFGTRDPRGDIGILATGFTSRLSRNLQLDAGVNFGVTRAADRINPFVGISARF